MMHLERYEKHAILEYYFEGGFDGDLEGCSAEVEAVIEDYLYRTSYHFRQEGVRLMHGSWERKVLKPRMPKDDLSSKVQVFDPVKHKKYIVYNGSPRGKKGNSLRIANQIIEGLKEAGISDGNIELRHLIHQDQHLAWAQNFSESNRFTKEIKDIIDELKARSQSAVETTMKVKDIVKEQNSSVSLTEDKFDLIAVAIEQTESISQKLVDSSELLSVNKEMIYNLMANLSAIAEENAAGSQQASASIEEQTATVEEIAKSSESLSLVAMDLMGLVKQFKI